MSPLIQLDSVSLELGAKSIFTELSFAVQQGDRLGIVGPNGAGKSTLLRLLAHELEPDKGRRIQDPATKVSFVPQSESFKEGSVLNYLTEKLSDDSADPSVAASKALSLCGFTDFSLNAQTLSGGWARRLSIATALAREPDLVLFDEPTNHLDFSGLQWLEALLSKARFSWIVVSHDRFFLNRTVSEVIEVAPYYDGGVFRSRGDYFSFQSSREAHFIAEEKKRSALANKARRELEWASRSPKARTGKAAFRMKEAARLGKELKESEKQIPKTQKVTHFDGTARGTKELVQIQQCTFGFSDNTPLISDLSFTIRNGMCLGILGANGQGKSTLMKLIAGTLKPTQGKVKQSRDLKVVYFDQLRERASSFSTLGELIGEGHDKVIYKGSSHHIAGWGKRFGFYPDQFSKLVANLSGGERARALLSILVREEADILLLDEPTNDLDIQMREALENMILEFQGAVALVTHDRFMLDEVCTHFLGFNEVGELSEYGSFEQWERLRQSEIPTQTTEKKSDKPKSKKKLSYNEQREYSKIEGKIEKAEEKLSEIEALAADPTAHTDHERSAEIAAELETARTHVAALYERWEELEELKNSLEALTKTP